MLGKYVRVKIVNPIGTKGKNGFVFPLNYGKVENAKGQQMAYVMGIHHPVCNFDGRIIAFLNKKRSGECVWIVAPKSTRFIINDIREYIDTDGDFKDWNLDCLYESSCGAVVFKQSNNETRFLLIKNKRSAHWGFSKGHIEIGETNQETAIREVLEETGLEIQILDNFQSVSDYKIQGRIEKNVTIFIAKALTSNIKIQEEEIDDYIWQTFEKAYSVLRFENDRNILKDAWDYLEKNKYV